MWESNQHWYPLENKQVQLNQHDGEREFPLTALSQALSAAVPSLLLPKPVPEAMILDSESAPTNDHEEGKKEETPITLQAVVSNHPSTEPGSQNNIGATAASEPVQVGLDAEGIRPQVGVNVSPARRVGAKKKEPGILGPKHQRKELTTAYVFDAQRRDLQETYLESIRAGLIPEHNAECRDISKEADEISKGNAARAKTKKRARVLRLVAKRWEIINELTAKFRLELEEIAQEYKGKVNTVMAREEKNGKTVEVPRQQVSFPDGSSAMMKTLYVPFDEFEKA